MDNAKINNVKDKTVRKLNASLLKSTMRLWESFIFYSSILAVRELITFNFIYFLESMRAAKL